MNHDQSIHPRVQNGRTVFVTVNTCKPRVGKAKKYDRKARRLNIRQNAWAASKKNSKHGAMTTRMPGSMNPHQR